jgi:DNA-binding GntR family transcriptional regulator
MMTKTDSAYALLRRAIVVGDLQEDEPLEESRLVTQFSVGRTPLREALKRLAAEQFINWPSHGTPYVRGVRVAELARLYEARILLEGPVARRAAERRTDAQLSQMQRGLDELQSAIEDGDVYLAVELDHSFHSLVATSTDNRFLAEAVRRLNCGSLRLWFLSHNSLSMAGVNEDHREIFDAIRKGEPNEAERVTLGHIRKSYDRQIQRQRLELDNITPAPSTGDRA